MGAGGAGSSGSSSSSSPFVDLYAVLRVGDAARATPEAIRRAWMRRAMETHPDKGGAGATQEAFLLVQRAWEVLGDEARRRAYDEERRMQLSTRRRLGGAGRGDCGRAVDCEVDLDDMETAFDPSSNVYVFSRRCRCGASVSVDEDQLEEHAGGAGRGAGRYHLQCPTCSLVTVVAYAAAAGGDAG